MIRMVQINGKFSIPEALFLRKVSYPSEEFIQISFPFNEDFRVQQMTISEAMSLKWALEELLNIKLLGGN